MNKIRILKPIETTRIRHTHGTLEIKPGYVYKIKAEKIKPNKNVVFPFLDPKVIMTVVVCMLMLAVGVFAFFTVWGSLEDTEGMETSGTRCQTVSNPAIAQTVTIPSDATVTRVYETLNTGSTQTIDSGNYTVVGTTVTINVTG